MKQSSPWRELALLSSEDMHYEHAPIQEAILEIRVARRTAAAPEALRRAVQQPGFRDPNPDLQVTTQVNVEPDEVSTSAERELMGFSAVRDDDKRVLRAWNDRFSYSWVKPYEDWEAFTEEALVEWSKYADGTNPSSIVRIGARFINRISILKSSVEIRDYLRTTVDISPYLPQVMAGYFAQVDIPLADDDAMARIISALAPPEFDGETAILLDIDAFKQVSIGLDQAHSRESLRNHLKLLRLIKNRLFEACITDATREVIR